MTTKSINQEIQRTLEILLSEYKKSAKMEYDDTRGFVQCIGKGEEANRIYGEISCLIDLHNFINE